MTRPTFLILVLFSSILLPNVLSKNCTIGQESAVDAVIRAVTTSGDEDGTCLSSGDYTPDCSVNCKLLYESSQDITPDCAVSTKEFGYINLYKFLDGCLEVCRNLFIGGTVPSVKNLSDSKLEKIFPDPEDESADSSSASSSKDGPKSSSDSDAASDEDEDEGTDSDSNSESSDSAFSWGSRFNDGGGNSGETSGYPGDRSEAAESSQSDAAWKLDDESDGPNVLAIVIPIVIALFLVAIAVGWWKRCRKSASVTKSEEQEEDWYTHDGTATQTETVTQTLSSYQAMHSNQPQSGPASKAQPTAPEFSSSQPLPSAQPQPTAPSLSSTQPQRQAQAQPSAPSLTSSQAQPSSQIQSSSPQPKVYDIWSDRELIDKKLNFSEIQDIKVLGSGAFGVVWLVSYYNTYYASKRLARNVVDPVAFDKFVDEVKLVARIEHANIIDCIGVAWTMKSDFQALFEYMVNGDLRDYLQRPNVPRHWTKEKLCIAIDIAEALVYVQSFDRPIVHRDLKSRNVLLSEEMVAKVSDFGSARLMSDSNTMTTQAVGTARWLAPEVVAGESYDHTCDSYSFGAILTELDTNEIPLHDATDAQGQKLPDFALMHRVASRMIKPSVSDGCPQAMRDLVDKCLNFDPKERPKAMQISFELRKMLKDGSVSES